jgi:hypothetical protein
MTGAGLIPKAGTDEGALAQPIVTSKVGFFDLEGARAQLRAITKTTSEGAQSNPVASATSPDQEDLPSYHAYLVEIPEGWKALRPVLYPDQDVPGEQVRPGIPAALLTGFQRYKVGVLLCHPETDGPAAIQEFAGDASLEAAFLGPDGQYLQASPVRPAFALLPLAAPTPIPKGQSRPGECLVLVPLIDSPFIQGKDYLSPRLIVDGVQVYPGMPGGAD